MKKIAAGIILVLLLVVPFINWRLGTVMWMSAWLMFILQKLFSREEWKIGSEAEKADKEPKDSRGKSNQL